MSLVVDAVRAHAAATPGSRAIVDACGGVSYEELAARIDVWSEALRQQGARTCALAARNSRDWIAADLAALATGVTMVPIPQFFSPAQERHVLDDSAADVLIAEQDDERDLAYAAAASPSPGLRIYRLREAAVARTARAAKISYTSGTTGRPKGVRLPLDAIESVAASVERVTRDIGVERHLSVLPLPMLLENVAGVYAGLLAGAEVAVPSAEETGLAGAAQLDIRRLVKCLAAYRAESVILVPQLLDALVRRIELGEESPRCLRFVAVGGGHTSTELLLRAERLNLPVFEGYGLTECGSVVTLNVPGARRVGSVGRVLPHARIRIDTGGEIVVSGALGAGYVGDAELDCDGCGEFRTGDLGHIDADDFLYVRGRRKNVFITSFGRNVSPEWVEAELAMTPRIAQALLCGEARPWNVAIIVPRPGADTASIDADVAAVNGALPDYARVGRWLAADEPFLAANGLATANGRPRREAILSRYADRIARCYDEVSSEQSRRPA